MSANPEDIRDPDLRHVEAALKRAGRRALELGLALNTPVLVMRDGKIVDIAAEEREKRAKPPR